MKGTASGGKIILNVLEKFLQTGEEIIQMSIGSIIRNKTILNLEDYENLAGLPTILLQ